MHNLLSTNYDDILDEDDDTYVMLALRGQHHNPRNPFCVFYISQCVGMEYYLCIGK